MGEAQQPHDGLPTSFFHMDKKETEDIEVRLFIDAIFKRYGYDFNEYAWPSLKRRVLQRLQDSGLGCIADMIPQVLHNEKFFELFLKDMSVTVTEMFRDPYVFKSIRENIIPKLKTYPHVNIWHAGCATGEEVYSIAILLHEEGFLDKCHIYATDFNNQSLSIAEKGIYEMSDFRSNTTNYIASGGKSSFSDYYAADYNSVKINDALKKNITFSHHNLIQDQVFAEVNIILCRNVMIYFKPELQNRCLDIFKQSLAPRGFLVLGDKESLRFSGVAEDFEDFDGKARISRVKLHV
jgi:chemotaxis protein methyltransferase CheR